MRFVLIHLCMMIVLLPGCNNQENVHTVVSRQAQTYQLATVQASTGAKDEYVRTGRVISDQRLALSSQLTGYIREIRVQEGENIQQGQVLVRLDASQVEGAIQQAGAELQAAQAAVTDARTDAEHLQLLFSQGHAADNELRKAQLRQDTALQTLHQAQAVLTTAKAQRQYSEIRSPLTGVVVDRQLRVGDLAAPNNPILTIEANQQWLFSTSLPEQQLANVSVGMPVTVYVDAVPHAIIGHVARIVPSQDTSTHTYQVKISLPAQPNQRLLSGMFGRAVFTLGQTAEVIVPKSALIERGGLQGVFVVDNQHKVQFRWLRLGREWPQQVAVNAGLSAGEQVVAIASPQLRDGDRVVALPVSR